MKKYYLCFEVTYKANIAIEYEEGEEWETTYERAKEYVWNNMNDGIEADIPMDDVTHKADRTWIEEWSEVKREETW